jgi:hypothetical protein
VYQGILLTCSPSNEPSGDSTGQNNDEDQQGSEWPTYKIYKELWMHILCLQQTWKESNGKFNIGAIP